MLDVVVGILDMLFLKLIFQSDGFTADILRCPSFIADTTVTRGDEGFGSVPEILLKVTDRSER